MYSIRKDYFVDKIFRANLRKRNTVERYDNAKERPEIGQRKSDPVKEIL